MATAINLCRMPCVVPSRIHRWNVQAMTRRRATRIVASYAADAESYSSQSVTKLPGSSPNPYSVAGVDQNNLVDPWLLAERDSRFAELFGVQLHYKIAHPSSDSESTKSNAEKANGAMPAKVGVPAVLLHGFGASVYSWHKVLEPLAAILGASVVSFDRPAFGLTGRPKLSIGEEQAIRRPNPFGLEFSAKATLSFAEFLHAQKIILIGHSAGSFVALRTYLDAPEKVAAIILIAPAVTAPLIVDEVKKVTTAPEPGEDQKGEKANSNLGQDRLTDTIRTARDATLWVLMQVVKLLRVIKAAVQALFQTLLPEEIVARVDSAIRSARERLLTVVFRSALAAWAVRTIMDRFGPRGVRLAWYDPKRVDAAVLHGYTKPLQCKDWDKALLEFVLAISVGPGGRNKAKIPLGKRLKDVTCPDLYEENIYYSFRRHGNDLSVDVLYYQSRRMIGQLVPVLIVSGDTDRLVPAWNGRRLASALPNAEFELIKECGHMPQEETPEEFLRIVEKFLARTFSLDPTSEPVPAPTP